VSPHLYEPPAVQLTYRNTQSSLCANGGERGIRIFREDVPVGAVVVIQNPNVCSNQNVIEACSADAIGEDTGKSMFLP
jgi:hypothetical protein